jgi:hypothetical protein
MPIGSKVRINVRGNLYWNEVGVILRKSFNFPLYFIEFLSDGKLLPFFEGEFEAMSLGK